MPRTLVTLAAVLLLAALAALAFWPERAAVEPGVEPGTEPEAAASAPVADAQDGESCTSCSLRHQRLPGSKASGSTASGSTASGPTASGPED